MCINIFKKILSNILICCIMITCTSLTAFANVPIDDTASSGASTSDNTVFLENPNSSLPPNISTNADASTMFTIKGGSITGFTQSYLDSIEVIDDKRYVDLVIPADINGTAITKIESKAFHSQSNILGSPANANVRIRSIDLSSATNLVEIESMAIYNYGGSLYDELNCTLTLPQNLKKIGSSAFAYQKGFTGNLVIPNSIEQIDENAFKECGFNGTLTLSNNELFNTISSQTFDKCKFTGELIIPNNIITINNRAFYSCIGITSTNLADCTNVATINNSAFYGCTGLTGQLTLPPNLTLLGNSAFYGCNGFSGSVTIPSGVSVFKSQVFHSTKFSTIYLPQNDNLEFEGNAYSDNTSTVLVCHNESIYKKYIAAYSSKKSYVGYETVLTFVDGNQRTPQTKAVLFNKPINFSKNEHTNEWLPDNNYMLPTISVESDTGYAYNWSFDGKTAATQNTIVTANDIEVFKTVVPPTVESQSITILSKDYDGKPLTLEVKMSHPLVTDNSKQYFFMYNFHHIKNSNESQWSKSNTYQHVINVSDSAPGGSDWYMCEAYMYDNKTPIFKYEFCFYADVKKATPVITPVFEQHVFVGTKTEDIKITLPPDTLDGEFKLTNFPQDIKAGNNILTWEFTPSPEQSANYSVTTGEINIIGKNRPVAPPPYIPPTEDVTPPKYGITENDDGSITFVDDNGYPIKSDFIQTDDGKTYFFDDDGKAVSGQQKIDENEYYFDEKGVMAKLSFISIKEKIKGKTVTRTFYYDKEGKMLKGVRSIKKEKYFFYPDGYAAKSEFITTGNKTYYFDKNGKSLDGLRTIKGKKYFFDKNGAMIKSKTVTVKGVKYKISSKGLATKISQ